MYYIDYMVLENNVKNKMDRITKDEVLSKDERTKITFKNFKKYTPLMIA